VPRAVGLPEIKITFVLKISQLSDLLFLGYYYPATCKDK
jgi:hypothetical protein